MCTAAAVCVWGGVRWDRKLLTQRRSAPPLANAWILTTAASSSLPNGFPSRACPRIRQSGRAGFTAQRTRFTSAKRTNAGTRGGDRWRRRRVLLQEEEEGVGRALVLVLYAAYLLC